MNITNRNTNLNFYAERKLKELGNFLPTLEHIERMKEILTRTGIVASEVIFPSSLTNQEVTCLILSIQGHYISKIAKEMNIAESTIQTYKQRIREKLNCNTMEQVVFKCMSYCYITPDENS